MSLSTFGVAMMLASQNEVESILSLSVFGIDSILSLYNVWKNSPLKPPGAGFVSDKMSDSFKCNEYLLGV